MNLNGADKDLSALSPEELQELQEQVNRALGVVKEEEREEPQEPQDPDEFFIHTMKRMIDKLEEEN